jgi:hypothetical protein
MTFDHHEPVLFLMWVALARFDWREFRQLEFASETDSHARNVGTESPTICYY